MADIKYSIEIDYNEAIVAAKNAGAKIKSELETELKKVQAEDIKLYNKENGDQLKRDLTTALDLLKKKKATASQLKRAYAQSSPELKEQSRRLKLNIQRVRRLTKEKRNFNKAVFGGRAKYKALNAEIAKAKAKIQQNIQAQRRFNNELAKGQKAMAAKAAKARPGGGGGGGGMFGGLAKGINGADALGAAFSLAAIKLRAITLGIEMLNKGITDVVNRARELSQLKVSLASFLESDVEIEGVLAKSQSLAMEYGIAVVSIEKAFKRVGPAAAAAGLDLEETSNIIEATSARMAQMGLNAEQSGRYMEAIAQIFGKGKLQSEELNQQLSELDGALRGQLKAYFETIGGVEDFNEAMKKGEIDARKFGEGLIYVSGDAMEKMKSASKELVQNFKNLKPEQQLNQLQTFLTQIQTNLSQVFGGFAQEIASAFAGLLSWFSSLSRRFPATTQILTQTFKTLGTIIKTIIFGFQFMIEVVLQAVEAFNKLILSIPGAQWLIEKVSGAWGAWSGRVDESNDLLARQEKQIEANNKKYKEAIDANKKRTEEENNSAESIEQSNKVLQNLIKTKGDKISADEDEVAAMNQAQAAYDEELEAYKNQKNNVNELVNSMVALAKAKKEARDAQIDAQFDKETAAIKRQKAALDELKESQKAAYEAQKSEIESAEKAEDRAHRSAMANLNQKKQRIQRLGKIWVAAIDKAKNAEKLRHSEAMRNLDSESRNIDLTYDIANSRIEGPTAAERELAKLEADKAKAAYQMQQISKEEMLQAQVKLQQMQQEDAIRQNNINRAIQQAQVEKKRQEEEQRHEEKMAQLEAEKMRRQEEVEKALARMDSAMESEKEKHNEIKDALEDKKEKLEEQNEEQETMVAQAEKELEAREENAKEVKKAAKQSNTVKKHYNNIVADAEDTAIYSADLQSNMANTVVPAQNVAAAMERQAAAAERIAAAQGGGGGGGSTSGRGAGRAAFNDNGFFAGGPMKGGQTATVNELGKEAFLTAQGHLSMINAPAWGKWTAPTSGTVIPAHLTKQLDIPAGGVSLNKKNIQNSQKSGGMGAVVKAIRQINGGNHINNTVTVQSSNPTQTANSMMVNLQKIRRMRYGR